MAKSRRFAACLARCGTAIVFPADKQMVGKVVMPLDFGELPMIVWLLIIGATVPGGEADLSPVN